ncbi:hypothetical protein Salat_0957000 [Sesamum alatum]|uniref:Uncharacterized protein n=1 Tax=Sesamum alatum TaxID=300844 RepID=A0AAE1YL01_9LAMI|nr:hypothetical protein Salat_0957000 [Sesamum alatum]
MTVKKSETKGKADEQRARPSSSRRKPEIDDIEDEQLEDEISQDTTMGTPMEASEEPMPCINQAQLSNNFPYNQALNVHPAPLAFWNPGDYMYSMGFQACNPIPINQQAGMSSDQYIYKVPQMYLEPGNSLQGNYFARSNCPYYPQSHDISDLISRRASISGSEDGSNVSVNHEIPAPILGSQESAQYSLSNEIPGPISRRQDEYSLSQNSASVHHEFPGPTFQGQKEVPLPQIPGPGPGPNSSVEEEFPGIMSLDMNEGWDLDYLSTVWSESPGPWPHPDPKLKFV